MQKLAFLSQSRICVKNQPLVFRWPRMFVEPLFFVHPIPLVPGSVLRAPAHRHGDIWYARKITILVLGRGWVFQVCHTDDFG